MRQFLFFAALVAFLPTATRAFDMPKDEEAARFVTSNIVSTFYHELGHALIDVMQLPVLGREEDAADTLSALLIDKIWQEDAAFAMVTDSALSYVLYDAENPASPDEQPFWDEHGLDLQRSYNLVCIFYGANPKGRAEITKIFDLPESRAERCPDEYAQAQASWGGMLDQISDSANTKGLVLDASLPKDPIVDILADEIKSLNAVYHLPEDVLVTVAPCDEPNAFYTPDDRTITICTELADDLARLWAESK